MDNASRGRGKGLTLPAWMTGANTSNPVLGGNNSENDGTLT